MLPSSRTNQRFAEEDVPSACNPVNVLHSLFLALYIPSDASFQAILVLAPEAGILVSSVDDVAKLNLYTLCSLKSTSAQPVSNTYKLSSAIAIP